MQYMAPERISGETYTFSSDLWSAGVTLLTLALGRYPYSADPTEQRRKAECKTGGPALLLCMACCWSWDRSW